MATAKLANRKSANNWKSPPGGYPDRQPDLVLRLEAEFARDPQLDSLRPWDWLETLHGILGDHRVSLSVFGDGVSPALFRTDLPWRSAPNCTRLSQPLSWFCSRENWSRLASIADSWWSLDATRGGGASHHEVWSLSWHGARRGNWQGAMHGPAAVALQVRTRHISDAQFKFQETLVENFFGHAGDAGSYYGRGSLLRPKDTLDRALAARLDEWLWELSERTRAPLVPGAFRFNYLDHARLDKLGGAARLSAIAETTASWMKFVPMRAGALIITDMWLPLCWNAGLSDLDECPSSERIWLLAEFARAGMLAVQHLDPEKHALRTVERAKAARQREQPPPRKRRSLRNWIAELRTRPPRCVRAVAAPAPGRTRSPGHPGAGVTTFAIVPSESKRALTLYGRPTGDPVLLGSPICAGSLKPERAAFAFDAVRDGWDGESSPPLAPPERPRLRQLACPRCGGRHFDLQASFEYPDDLDDLLADDRKHAEDFFTWFWLAARCVACHWEGIAAEIECA